MGADEPTANLLLRAYLDLRHRIVDRRIRKKAQHSPVLLALGAGDVPQHGWIATDREHLDLLRLEDWQRYFREESVDAMIAEHVWEHLSEADALGAARNCYRFLKPGGYLRVAVPDGCHPSPAYLEAVRPMGSGAGSDDHKVLYTHATLARLFEQAGFRVELLEYFDEQGRFHQTEWQPEAGLIERSASFDARNRRGELNYTSIILDARKG